MSEMTQEEKLLDYFKRWAKLGLWRSPAAIVADLHILCYTRRITELRRSGHKIEMRWHVNSEGRKDYTEYRIVE